MADASVVLAGPQIAGTARDPRSDVAQVGSGSGKLAHPATSTFSDGARSEFDVPRAGRSAAQRVVTSLGA